MKRTHDGLSSLDLDALTIKRTKFQTSNDISNVTFPAGSYTIAKTSDIVAIPADVVTEAKIQTVTNKDLSSVTNTFPADIVRTTEADAVTITNATQSTNATSGALIVSGGVGIGKNVHVSGTVHALRGSASAPTFAFAPDPTTGIYSASANQINIATNGVNRVNIATSTVTSLLPVVVPSGTSAECGLQISAGAGCGIYSNGANTINFATSGVERLNITSSGYMQLLYGQLVVPNGSATTPSISWAGSSINSGIYLVGTDNVGFSANGTLVSDFNSSRWAFGTGITLPTTGGSPSSLDFYQELTHTSGWNFGSTNQNVQSGNFRYVRVGKKVTMTITYDWSAALTMGDAGGGNAIMNTAVASVFRPTQSISFIGYARVGGTDTTVRVIQNSNGTTEITPLAGNFTNGTTLRLWTNSFSYSLT
jgi:hypothetical protein